MNSVEYKWIERRPGKKGGTGRKVTFRLCTTTIRGRVKHDHWSSLWLEFMVRTETYKLHRDLPRGRGLYARYETIHVGIKSLDDAKQLAEATLNLIGELK